ncbi:MAG: hypothetical protein NT116_04250 [Candidatus Parcubacteria bacterium]|nr:hypothetical protein [Candidatus Parcubacteria bacterium]
MDDYSVTRAWLNELCLQNKTWHEISKIVVAATAYRPSRSDKWLQIICEPFILNLFREDVDLLKQNPAFILGTTLGLFQAINWLDQYWWAQTSFESDFYDEVAEIILWKDQFSDLADQLLPDSAYESQLSQAVKAFFRHQPMGFGGKGIRMANTLKFVQKVLSKLVNEAGTKKELSKIGSLVLDQISYAWFGSASLMGRVNGIMLFGKKCDFDKALAAKALPKLYGDKELFSASMQILDSENNWEFSAFQMQAKATTDSKAELIWQIIQQADEKIKAKIELSKQVQVLLDKIAYAIFDQLDSFDRALTAILPITNILNELLSQSGRRLLRPDQ